MQKGGSVMVRFLAAACLLMVGTCCVVGRVDHSVLAQTTIEPTEFELQLVENYIVTHADTLIQRIINRNDTETWNALLTAAKNEYQKREVTNIVNMADDLGVPRTATIQQLADAIGYVDPEP